MMQYKQQITNYTDYLEDKLNISVGYVKNYPLSVDTSIDLAKIKSLMET